ncbi:hypothetical protein ACROYT_G015032 [Oculina patagonica]
MLEKLSLDSVVYLATVGNPFDGNYILKEDSQLYILGGTHYFDQQVGDVTPGVLHRGCNLQVVENQVNRLKSDGLKASIFRKFAREEIITNEANDFEFEGDFDEDSVIFAHPEVLTGRKRYREVLSSVWLLMKHTVLLTGRALSNFPGEWWWANAMLLSPNP